MDRQLQKMATGHSFMWLTYIQICDGTGIHTTVLILTNTVLVPNNYMHNMTDSGSVKTGIYLSVGRLYTGIADCERWLVD